MAKAITVLPSKKKVVWFYQSNPNPFDLNETKQWERYSDFENDYIEEAYQRKEQEVHLNDYVIDFTHQIQYKTNEKDKQRPIKRGDISLSQYVRAERFSYPEKAVSFNISDDYFSAFIERWRDQNKGICKPDEDDQWSAIAEQAAQGKDFQTRFVTLQQILIFTGILKEGKLLNQDFDAQRMAKQLMQCRDSMQLQECAARLYSAESFLYKLVNSSLRNEVMSKANTLGPFCYILWMYLRFGMDNALETVYRGTTLTLEMINEYKRAVGRNIQFPAFTSTSKRIDIAERFGNTLFIIKLSFGQNANNISHLSYYPNEEEVLLRANYQFTIEEVKTRPGSDKVLIYLRETSF